MISECIHKLVDKTDLSKQEAYDCVMEIMSGNTSAALIASYLTALRMKGETVQEVSGSASAMREMATAINTKHSHVIDTCGTGGDGLGTFNISTAAAIVASSAGAVVAKHGNRAISSKCGSADVLKALGVNIELSKEKTERCLDEIHIAFLFAPSLHGAMKHAAPIRKELGIRTIFNILGPLTNPAGARRQLLGVFSRGLTDVMANVLLDLGSERAMVVHGNGGIDELSTIGESHISEVNNGTVSTYTFNHESVGIQTTDIASLSGGDAAMNREIIERILNGEKGAPRDIVVLNAGAALYVAEKAESVKQGVREAQAAIDTRSARKKLDELIAFTNS